MRFGHVEGRTILVDYRWGDAGRRRAAVYEWRVSAVAGGVMCNGTSLTDTFRQLGRNAGHCPKGASPCLAVPRLILGTAGEVIE